MTAFTTETLIRQLVADLSPVRRLRPPALRLALWLTICVPWVGMFVLLRGPSAGLLAQFSNPSWMIEQCAALSTALAAGMAALGGAVPGRTRREALLPIVPMVVWLGALIHDCMLEHHATAHPHFYQDWFCVAAIPVMSAVPAIVLIMMLRRGLPRAPATTAMLVLLAAGASAHVALRVFYQQSSSLMILVWQIGTIAGLAIIAAAFGRKILQGPPSAR